MSENTLASGKIMYSSVNGLPIPMPEVIDNTPDAVLGGITQQEKLEARFMGTGATEGQKLFLTENDHIALKQDEAGRAARASGSKVSFGMPQNISPELQAEWDANKAARKIDGRTKAAKAEQAVAA